MLLGLPLLLFLVKKPAGFFANWLAVIAGKKTWIGYIDGEDSQYLPSIPHGVLSPAGNADLSKLSLSPDIINFRYARDFSVNNDLQILLSYLKYLGNT